MFSKLEIDLKRALNQKSKFKMQNLTQRSKPELSNIFEF